MLQDELVDLIPQDVHVVIGQLLAEDLHQLWVFGLILLSEEGLLVIVAATEGVVEYLNEDLLELLLVLDLHLLFLLVTLSLFPLALLHHPVVIGIDLLLCIILEVFHQCHDVAASTGDRLPEQVEIGLRFHGSLVPDDVVLGVGQVLLKERLVGLLGLGGQLGKKEALVAVERTMLALLDKVVLEALSHFWVVDLREM